MKKNIWVIAFFVLLAGAILAMWAAGRNANLPPIGGQAESEVNFTFNEDEHIKGAESPKVTIVEYGDFQCPACAAYAPFIGGIIASYPDSVRVVYRHYPLKTIHFRAEAAALAAVAAGYQGKFWEMHDRIFAEQNVWSVKRGDADFEKYATEIGLDLNKFKQDINSFAAKERVDRDFKHGISLGINSTPTLYVNGKLFDNRQSGDALLKLVESELAL